MTLTPSIIIKYLYCPRFTWFEHVMAIPEYEERHYKVMRGRQLHDDKLERNKDYLRKRIGVVDKHLDQYLTNTFLRGRMDEVLELQDGTMAPLDYKFARYEGRVYETYRTQLQCYAVLIEENFGKAVDRGYLVYVRSRNKLVEVPISDADKAQVRECAAAILRIIGQNRYPKATRYKKRCTTCHYRNICTK